MGFLFISGFFTFFVDNSNFTPFPGQTVKQLKHPTHLVKSTCFAFASIHPDLQFAEQTPQLVHSVSSSFILKMENRDIIPKNVPTGQTELQYRRPCLNDKYPTNPRKASEKPAE